MKNVSCALSLLVLDSLVEAQQPLPSTSPRATVVRAGRLIDPADDVICDEGWDGLQERWRDDARGFPARRSGQWLEDPLGNFAASSPVI